MHKYKTKQATDLSEFFNSYKGGAGGNPYFRPHPAFEVELTELTAEERRNLAKEVRAQKD